MIIVTTESDIYFLDEKDFKEINYNTMSRELTWSKTIRGVLNVRQATGNKQLDNTELQKYNALKIHADKLQHIIDYMRRQRATQTKIIEDIYQISTSKDVNHKTAREYITKLCEKCISECEDTYNEARKNGWI